MVNTSIVIAVPVEDQFKKSLEESLNSFIADEYITASQYFLSAMVAKGKCIDYLTKLFQDSYADELTHMNKIVTFMQSVGMNANVSLSELIENSTFPFHHINAEESTASLCRLMIESENAAIESYSAFLRSVETSDYPDLKITIGAILAEEREHKKELEDLLSSIGDEPTSVLNVELVDKPTPDVEIDTEILPSSIHNMFKSIF